VLCIRDIEEEKEHFAQTARSTVSELITITPARSIDS